MSEQQQPEQQLVFTGERFTPECVREIWYEHMHRYAFAAELVKGLTVCDAACGEGYGTAILRAQAQRVAGVDIDELSIQHASRRYGEDFHQASVTDMPFADHSFDALVSFETIEHLAEQQAMLREFRRVLKPDGFVIISSPDKRWYSDAREYSNPHHVKELYREEFSALLKQYFPCVSLFGQRLLFQSVIWSEADNQQHSNGYRLQIEHNQSVSSSPQSAYPPLYNIAICAADSAHLPANIPGLCLFGDKNESVYEHYNEQVRKNIKAGHDLMERDQRIQALRAKLDDQ